MRVGVCFVLPLYDAGTEQHFSQLYALLQRVAAASDLFVIVEEAKGRVNLGPARVYVQRFRAAPLRALEMFVVMAWAVLRGHRQVYTHYSTFGAMASVLCRWLLGARAFYWNCEENAGHWLPWRWNRETIGTKLRVEWPTAFVIKSVDYLVTGTRRMAEYYRRVYGIGTARTLVLANSFDEERFFPGPASAELRRELALPADGLVALFVHRLAPRKGSRDLPQIMAETTANVTWIVCGDGPDRAWLTEELAHRGLTDRVRLLGNVPNARVGEFYRIADLLVMPSRQEGFPRVLLEAQAAGLPFVATDVGGVRDVVGALAADEALVARGAVDALCTRVRLLLANPDLRARLRAEGLENVQRFSRDVFVARFLEIVALRRLPHC